MIEFSVSYADFSDIIQAVRSLEDIQIDMVPLGPDIERILMAENERARLAGLDKDGNPLEPVKRPDDPRRGGSGPPLAPKGSGSRVIANHKVEIGEVRVNFLRGRAFWEGADFLRYHAEGRGRYGPIPVRDVMGHTVQAEDILGDTFEEFVRLRLQEHLDRVLGVGASAATMRGYLTTL